ncbi:MAG: SPFH domain-containing protein [Anaerolineales bacterium]|jgi:hypothetical protein|nr:SPFH domain-containing protein [Anaerolineales bacterium]
MENTSPLGKAFYLTSLHGRLSKTLDVPVGRTGIVILRSGQVRTYPAGIHTVLSAWERLLGKGEGLIAGYVPAEPFSAWANANNLLSGDDELVDISLVLAARVSEVETFFRQQVFPQGELHAAQMDLSGEVVQGMLNSLVCKYTAADLVRGMPEHILTLPLIDQLRTYLLSQGLEVLEFGLLNFRRSADRVRIREKLADLDERLRTVNLDEEMSRIENNVQLREFMQQFAPELAAQTSFQLPSAPAAAASSQGKPPSAGSIMSLGEQLRLWVDLQIGKLSSWNHWRLDRLLSKAQQITSSLAEGPETMHVEQLAGRDRERVDRFVRDQCNLELSQVYNILDDMQSRLFRGRQEQAALAVKQLKSKTQRYQQSTKNPSYGRPPYLEDFDVPNQAYKNMLDFDEELLEAAAALSERSLDLQSKLSEGQFHPENLNLLENELDRFQKHFGDRARAVR